MTTPLAQYSFELTRPWFLAGLAVLPLLVYYYRHSLVDFPRVQRRVSLVVRTAVALLLVLALAGLTLLMPTRQLFVVFAVDRSVSVGDTSQQAAERYVREALEHVQGNRYAVLPFASVPGELSDTFEPRGEGADDAAADAVDAEPTPISESGGDETQREDHGTDLAAAIEVARAGIPPHHVPRIVLLTDGNETDGAALKAALAAGIPISTVPLSTRDDPEVQVSAVDVPAQVAQGEPFYVEVVIDANHDDQVQIEVYRGPHKVVDEQRAIQKGENRFRFQQSIDRDRLAELTVRIRGGTDTLLDNNTASGLVYAAGKPRVLLIESAPELARHIQWALEEEDILVDTRPPEGMPDSLGDLQNYEVVMISNVPATALSARKMDVLRTYVEELGGGLIMIGGDQSFGLGGYYKSILEEILPVRSDFEKEKEKPSLAMVLVIDKSGSMGGQKIELAKDAARSAVELLGAQDQVGVIAFDGQTYWVSEVRPCSNKGAVIDRVSTIEAGGGTTMYPAMEAAYDALQMATAKLKHVIILTDGISSPGDFEGIAQAMSASRMTVSTVGVGRGADHQLLESIASLGQGRYYFTDDALAIPQIFAKETITASKSAINEQPFVPQVVRPAQALAQIDFLSAPFLLGYVVTRPKPTSEVVLASESGDPLLAWWRYGLGMSVAFTSDAKSRWAAEWLSWPGFNKFWAQLIRHTMRKSQAMGFVVEVQRNAETTTVSVDSTDPLGGFLNQAETELTLIGPRLASEKVAMVQTAPGRYVAEVETPERGAYHLELAQKHRGQLIYRQSRGLVVGYPDELRLKPLNETLLRSIAEGTQGEYDPPPESVFREPVATADLAKPLWPLLTALALLLFVIDVALRRIDFSLIFPRKVA